MHGTPGGVEFVRAVSEEMSAATAGWLSCRPSAGSLKSLACRVGHLFTQGGQGTQ